MALLVGPLCYSMDIKRLKSPTLATIMAQEMRLLT
jgi:hypothetical protein